LGKVVREDALDLPDRVRNGESFVIARNSATAVPFLQQFSDGAGSTLRARHFAGFAGAQPMLLYQ
jgi:hypothetical protein